MKRTIAGLLVFTLILLMASCSRWDIAGGATGTPERDTPKETDSSEETDAPEETDTAEGTEAPEETDLEGTAFGLPAHEANTYEMGSMVSGSYNNSFLKISCTLDENWIYYNEEQLAELNGLFLDTIGDDLIADAIAEALESGKIIYDMSAASSDGMATITICFENLGVVYGLTMDESEYVDAAQGNVERLLSSMGINDISLEKISFEFAGVERMAIFVSGSYSGVPFYEVSICIKQGSYMANITLCSLYENVTQELAGLFSSTAKLTS